MFILLMLVLGAVGVFFRYFGVDWINSILAPTDSINIGLLWINVLGSFLIGVAFVIKSKPAFNNDWFWLVIAVGFLGAFTTFSSYSLEVVKAVLSKQYMLAMSNVFLHNFFALLFCFVGYWVATKAMG